MAHGKIHDRLPKELVSKHRLDKFKDVTTEDLHNLAKAVIEHRATAEGATPFCCCCCSTS